MALNLKNPEVEILAAEVAALSGETKTEAIRRALLDRKARLSLARDRSPKLERWERFLRNRVWPQIPAESLGRAISKQEREEILGYGPDGV
jgi:antitoxin VapB